MKKRNIQTIKHVIGVLIAEGAGNEIIEHCIEELAAMIEKDQLTEYVQLLAKETARELRPKLEAMENAVHRVPRIPRKTTALVVDGPAPEIEPFPTVSPFLHQDPSDQSALSARPAAGLAAELRPFLKGRGNSDEREIVSAIFGKFHCKNVELAEVLGVRPNLIAKVKSGLGSPTVTVALKRFMEER